MDNKRIQLKVVRCLQGITKFARYVKREITMSVVFRQTDLTNTISSYTVDIKFISQRQLILYDIEKQQYQGPFEDNA